MFGLMMVHVDKKRMSLKKRVLESLALEYQNKRKTRPCKRLFVFH